MRFFAAGVITVLVLLSIGTGIGYAFRGRAGPPEVRDLAQFHARTDGQNGPAFKHSSVSQLSQLSQCTEK